MLKNILRQNMLRGRACARPLWDCAKTFHTKTC